MKHFSGSVTRPDAGTDLYMSFLQPCITSTSLTHIHNITNIIHQTYDQSPKYNEHLAELPPTQNRHSAFQVSRNDKMARKVVIHFPETLKTFDGSPITTYETIETFYFSSVSFPETETLFYQSAVARSESVKRFMVLVVSHAVRTALKQLTCHLWHCPNA